MNPKRGVSLVRNIQFNKPNYDKKKIIEKLTGIIRIASDGTIATRLDGVLAFECEYLKHPNDNSFTFVIPIKYNPVKMNSDEEFVNTWNDFEKDAIAQRDILLTYLKNIKIINKVNWRLTLKDTWTPLSISNLPNYSYTVTPDVVLGKYDIEIYTVNNIQSIAVKLTRK